MNQQPNELNVPEGCELVALPTEVVSDWADPTTPYEQPESRDAVIMACRALRGKKAQQ